MDVVWEWNAEFCWSKCQVKYQGNFADDAYYSAGIVPTYVDKSWLTGLLYELI